MTVHSTAGLPPWAQGAIILCVLVVMAGVIWRGVTSKAIAERAARQPMAIVAGDLMETKPLSDLAHDVQHLAVAVEHMAAAQDRAAAASDRAAAASDRNAEATRALTISLERNER